MKNAIIKTMSKARIRLHKISLIEAEYNTHNGLIVSLLRIDLFRPSIDSALIGVNISTDFLYISFMFMEIKVFDKYD